MSTFTSCFEKHHSGYKTDYEQVSCERVQYLVDNLKKFGNQFKDGHQLCYLVKDTLKELVLECTYSNTGFDIYHFSRYSFVK
jgi:hypothetical protein